MRRPRALLAVVSAALLLVGPVACGVRTDRGPSFADEADVPFGLLDPATTTTTASTTTTTAPPPEQIVLFRLCFRRGDRVVVVARDAPAAGAPLLADIVEALVAGPDEGEQAIGLGSALFAPDLVLSVTPAAGVAAVDLAPTFTAAGITEQLLAIAAIVCTLTSQPGIGQVAFTLAGAPIEVPRGDGSLTGAPVSRDDYAGLLDPS